MAARAAINTWKPRAMEAVSESTSSTGLPGNISFAWMAEFMVPERWDETVIARTSKPWSNRPENVSRIVIGDT